MFKVIVLVMAIASASCAVRGVARSVPSRPIKMEDLTVPKERLPVGCGLSPAAYVVEGNRVRGRLWAGLEVPTNPWTGTERRVIASIREHTDGPSLVPERPIIGLRSDLLMRSFPGTMASAPRQLRPIWNPSRVS